MSDTGTLVLYFSAEGNTAKVVKEYAEKLAPSVPGAEIVDAKVVKSAGEIK